MALYGQFWAAQKLKKNGLFKHFFDTAKCMIAELTHGWSQDRFSINL